MIHHETVRKTQKSPPVLEAQCHGLVCVYVGLPGLRVCADGLQLLPLLPPAAVHAAAVVRPQVEVWGFDTLRGSLIRGPKNHFMSSHGLKPPPNTHTDSQTHGRPHVNIYPTVKIS